MENIRLRTILHVDMNSYFATCEQQANPYLRGKPVGIVKAAGRGCVIAASIEAKKFGVKTGCTVWEAKKLCPQIYLVPSDMDKYFALTDRLINIAKRYSPTVEIFSIDELFIDLTEVISLYPGGAFEVALSLKNDISEEMGNWMKASVGISFTKLLAKLASEMKKPNGLVFLSLEDYLSATENLAVEEVCGIGYARTAYLHSRGAYTLGEARKLDLPQDVNNLVWLKVDEPLTSIADLEPAKSVSRTFTTFRPLNQLSEIERLVRNLVEEATAKLREMDMVGRTMALSVDSFWTRKTLVFPVDHGGIIFKLLWSEFVKRPVFAVRHVGVWISNLNFYTQESLFAKERTALKAMDVLNEKYGLFTVYPGQLLGGELIRPEVTGYLGDKWYRFGRPYSSGKEISVEKFGAVNAESSA